MERIALIRLLEAGLLAGLVAGPAGPATARTWRVPADAPTIAAGLDSARAGDIIEVAGGTYLEHDLILKDGVTLRGETGRAGDVVIDAARLGHVLLAEYLGPDTCLEGMTLTRGDTRASPVHGGWGGGLVLWESSPVVERCAFVDNVAPIGGGLVAYRGAPRLAECRFANNLGTQEGGAMELSSTGAVLVDCTFTGNEAYTYGGALTCYGASSPEFTRCRFEDNVAGEEGGVLDLAYDAEPTFTACLFTGNRAGWFGGALNVVMGRLTLRDCSVTGNAADGRGGGISLSNAVVLEAHNTDVRGNSAADGGPDGHVTAPAQALLTCCDVDLDGWAGDGTVSLDNDGCAVVLEPATWGGVKALYR